MVVTKSDLTIPASSNIIVFADGETVDASRVNANFATLLSFATSLTNYSIDQTPQINAGVTTTYLDEQDFEAGIRVDSIKEATTNSDIVVSFDGTGKLKYGGTASTLEVATQLYVAQQIAAGVVSPVVFTGATDSTAGTTGLVPAPIAGQARKVLLGGSTWGDPIPFNGTLQTGNFNFLEDQIYYVDLSSTAITGTLPASPNDGAVCGIVDVNRNASVNNFTFGRNGNTMQGVDGLVSEDFVSDQDGDILIFKFRNASGGWFIV